MIEYEAFINKIESNRPTDKNKTIDSNRPAETSVQ